MRFQLLFSPKAAEALSELAQNDPKKHRKVLKTLALMETNLRHPGLKTHKYNSLKGSNQEEIFEAYVENKTPAAFRIFWHYGPNPAEITVLAIVSHP